MNKVVLIGRLTDNPKVSGSETTVARYSLAVDRIKEGTDFINCVAFGKTGDFAKKYLVKGMKIAVTGRIQTGSYTGRDGKKIYTTDVVVDSHEFVESRKGNKKDDDGFEPIPEGLPWQ